MVARLTLTPGGRMRSQPGWLSESEVKEFIATILHRIAERAGEAFVRAILHERESTPFFIEEGVLHLVAF